MANQYQHDFADIVDIDTKYCTNVQCLNSFKHMGKSIKIKFRRYRRKVHQIFFISDSNVYVYQYDILDVDLNRDYRSSFMSLKVCFYLFTYNL